jgi:hypothetical protein
MNKSISRVGIAIVTSLATVVVLAPREGSADNPACPWEANNIFIRQDVRTGTRCNSPSSVEVDAVNIGQRAVKIYPCLQDDKGKWICTADGKFDNGVRPTEKTNHFVCKGNGQHKVWSMPIETYVANHCGWPPREP